MDLHGTLKICSPSCSPQWFRACADMLSSIVSHATKDPLGFPFTNPFITPHLFPLHFSARVSLEPEDPCSYFFSDVVVIRPPCILRACNWYSRMLVYRSDRHRPVRLTSPPRNKSLGFAPSFSTFSHPIFARPPHAGFAPPLFSHCDALSRNFPDEYHRFPGFSAMSGILLDLKIPNDPAKV